jgi:hypothetical protein
LQNHREVIAAFDFLTVPTDIPTALLLFPDRAWTSPHSALQRHLPPDSEVGRPQLREAFPEAGPYRYAIFDRDSTVDDEVVTFLKATGLKLKRTGVAAPWQNGIAERWVGSCRREILDHVIALNEQHLRRLIRDYVNYHHAASDSR